MTQHFQKEIETLKRRLLSLGTVVEETVRSAVQAVSDRDRKLAARIIEGDMAIDNLEVSIEEECLKLLALHQPVAIDLRFLIAVIKMNSDLERIADLAVNIAERAAFLATEPPLAIPFDFPAMSEKTQAMLRRTLDALVNLDGHLAAEVCRADDEIDAINREMYAQVREGMRANPDDVERLLHMLAVSRHLERIADHATNIAEDVIYMVEGEIVRHKAEEYSTAS
jgi:phosphate transport system protein